MHAYQLADLAAVICVQGRPLTSTNPETMDRALAAYWKASRCRIDRWGRHLKAFADQSDQSVWPPTAVRMLEEILVSEILTRTVAAIAAIHDQRHGASEFAPIARNIFVGHVDIKRRAIAVIAAPHRDARQAEAFLALRRQCDRWSDLLLAYLEPYSVVAPFAARPARVSDFASDAQQHLRSAASSDMTLTMILAGMRSSLVPLATVRTPNSDLNLEIATALIGCFSPDSFDSFGLPYTKLLDQLGHVPNESLATLAEWWQPKGATSSTPARPRWRR
jgi:hypothetical protein